jgi:hypothetical protein
MVYQFRRKCNHEQMPVPGMHIVRPPLKPLYNHCLSTLSFQDEMCFSRKTERKALYY